VSQISLNPYLSTERIKRKVRKKFLKRKVKDIVFGLKINNLKHNKHITTLLQKKALLSAAARKVN
jgi:hypothetical protein